MFDGEMVKTKMSFNNKKFLVQDKVGLRKLLVQFGLRKFSLNFFFYKKP